MTWSLQQLLSSLHDDIQHRLETARKNFNHPVAKGDATENVWLKLLESYLPERYRAAKAFIVDSKGVFSEQMDVVVFDRQYSPFIFTFEGQTIIPAESVYAVFETKQTLNADHIVYAQNKVSSVRKLYCTSLPIPHAGGVYKPKPAIPIIGGILTLDSDWTPALGETMLTHLNKDTDKGLLNLGCVAGHGHFFYNQEKKVYEVTKEGKPATAFLFKLISELQFSGTVPMIDVSAYSEWLAK